MILQGKVEAEREVTKPTRRLPSGSVLKPTRCINQNTIKDTIKHGTYQVPNTTCFSTKLPSSESLLKTQDCVQKSKFPEDGTLVPKDEAVGT
jgi:hypothetical protein